MSGFDFTIVCLGITSGIIGSLLGLGGGMILVPALLLFTNLSHELVVGSSLFTVVVSSIASSENKLKESLVPIRLATHLEVYGISGGVLGALVVGAFSKNLLMSLLGVLMLIVSVKIFVESTGKKQLANEPEVPRQRRFNKYVLNGVAGFAGTLSGLLGIGGGIILVPCLNTFGGLSIKKAVAASAYMMGVSASGGAFVYLLKGRVDIHLTALAILGVFPGARIGHWISNRLNPQHLRVIFAIVLFVFAIRILSRS